MIRMMMTTMIHVLMMMMTFDRSPLAHLRSIAREKITALSPGFNAAWWWPSPCLPTYMTFMNMMGIRIIILVPHDRHDDLYEGNHDCCVSIQPYEWWWSSSFDFIGFYEGQEIPFTNLELFAPSSVLVSKVLRNYFQDYFPKTIENFSVCPLSGGFFFLCKHSFSWHSSEVI